MATDAQHTVLVVDDEPSICWGLQQILRGEGHRVLTASSAEEGLRLAARRRIALVVLDVRLPGEDGISALPKFLDATGGAAVVVITAFGDLEIAVEAIRQGATDYLTKPFAMEDALRVCRSAIHSSVAAQPTQPPEGEVQPRREQLIGQSQAMQHVFRQIALVADSRLSVLITGETGTGKELVAAAIQRHSDRSQAPYLPVAPVALHPDLVESELFGHVQGAFPGAAADRPGLFALADGGTVLLDEIGDLPMAIQIKLLRVLEQGEYTPVGDVRPRRVDVRVLAATQRDLRRQVDAGLFREDLFYRLTAVKIQLPALRERRDDVPLLAEHFLRLHGHPAPQTAIPPDVLQELQHRPWYGNVRELRNVVEHASVIARGRRLSLEHLPPPEPRRGDLATHDGTPDAAVQRWTGRMLEKDDLPAGSLHEQFLASTEPALLRAVLEHTGGNRAAAADLLGIHRGTLRERLKRYGLDAEHQ